MLVEELFKKNNIPCPEWISKEEIGDNWKNANYYKENNVDKWRLITMTGYLIISYDNKNYTYEAYDKNNNCIFIKEIDENTVSIT